MSGGRKSRKQRSREDDRADGDAKAGSDSAVTTRRRETGSTSATGFASGSVSGAKLSRSTDDGQGGSNEASPSVGVASELVSVLSRLALFGNSASALMLSFVMLLCSVVAAWYLDGGSNHAHANATAPLPSLGPVPDIGPPVIFQVDASVIEAGDAFARDRDRRTFPSMMMIVSQDMRDSFDRDGVIAVRGLIPPSLLARLDAASDDLVEEQREKARDQPKPRGPITGRGKPGGRQFHTVHSAAIFRDLPDMQVGRDDIVIEGAGGDPFITDNSWQEEDDCNNSDNSDRLSVLPAFLETALFSNVPLVAAELLGIRNGNDEDTDGDAGVGAKINSNRRKDGYSNNDNKDNGNKDKDSNEDSKNDSEDRESTKSTMRVLRDIFLAKDKEQYVCGWHVDDTGFWPADASAPGVNAWIALDDMPVDRGGGFALAVGSHRAPWRNEAYRVTGATPFLPEEGFRSAADMFRNRTGEGTCNVERSAPHLHRRMEDTKRVYDIRRGDVIFHDRWLFHRTVALDHDAMRQHRRGRLHEEGSNDEGSISSIGNKDGNGNDSVNNDRDREIGGSGNGDFVDFVDSFLSRRYSIRYGPGSSQIPRGYGTEPSVLWDERNGGRTADEVVSLDGPWYPQAWPTSFADVGSMKALRDERFGVVEDRLRLRKAEMRPHLKRVGRNQQQH